MLISLRERATSFFAKLLLVMLIASFALWGIGDIFRNNSPRQVLAAVEDQEITAAEYRDVFRLREKNIQQMLGEDFSPELMKQLGLERVVLDEMINLILLQKETGTMGIQVGSAPLARKINDTPAFKNEAGQFDRALFQNGLRNLGISEEYYLEKLRGEIGGNLLAGAFSGKGLVPQTLTRQIYMARKEKRVAEMYIVPQRAVKKVEAPDKAALDAYYGSFKSNFTAPEYRGLQYAVLDLDHIREKASAIKDSEIQAYYKEHIANYTDPEKRQVEQLLYASREKAQEARRFLQQGASFADATKKFPAVNAAALSLGAIQRGQLPEEAQDAVFSLEKGAVSEPVETPFGWHLYTVKAITPERVSKLEEVKSRIAQELSHLHAEDELYQLANALEDQLAGGSTLKEAAEMLGLTVSATPPLDKAGLTEDGKPFSSLPPYENFLSTAFAMEEGGEPRLTPAGDSAYFAIALERIVPERVRPLEEVRPQLLAAWQKEEKQKRLQQLAEELAAGLKKDRNATLKRFAALGIAPFSSGKMERDGAALPEDSGKRNFPLPEALTARLFQIGKGDNTGAHRLYNDDYMIAVLKEVIAPPLPSPEDTQAQAALAAAGQELEQQYGNELYDQYMRYLRKKYSVAIDESAFQSITSGE